MAGSRFCPNHTQVIIPAPPQLANCDLYHIDLMLRDIEWEWAFQYVGHLYRTGEHQLLEAADLELDQYAERRMLAQEAQNRYERRVRG